MIPSKFQADVFDFVATGSGNAIVNAVAGSGKTTTIVKAVELANCKDVLFCAFNKHIENELSTRLKGRAFVKTIHGIGYATLAARIGRLTVADDKDNASTKMAGTKLWKGLSEDDQEGYEQEDMIKAIRDAIHFVKVCLLEKDDQKLEDLMCFYGVDIPGGFSTKFASSVWDIIRDSADMAYDGVVSYDDMIFAPWFFNWHPAKFSFVFVDEAQDLSAAQRWLVVNSIKDGGRCVAVGDPMQSIQGFAGADPASFTELKKELNAVELPLSICYRCPPNHLERAREYVPEIQAVEGRENGILEKLEYEAMTGMIAAQDLIICRKTAPIIELALHLIARRKPAKIRGRDIGAGLARDVESIADMRGFKFQKFEDFCRKFFNKKAAKFIKKDNEAAAEAIMDRCEAVIACCDGIDVDNAIDLAREIRTMFSDAKEVITLSTVHRSKGLEADRVFIIEENRLPMYRKGMQDWQRQQEDCIHYVALTRARKELYCVSAKRKE